MTKFCPRGHRAETYVLAPGLEPHRKMRRHSFCHTFLGHPTGSWGVAKPNFTRASRKAAWKAAELFSQKVLWISLDGIFWGVQSYRTSASSSSDSSMGFPCGRWCCRCRGRSDARGPGKFWKHPRGDTQLPWQKNDEEFWCLFFVGWMSSCEISIRSIHLQNKEHQSGSYIITSS